jgi:hypothetical protein
MTVNVDTYVLPEDSDFFLAEVLPPSDALRVTWEVLEPEEKAAYLSAALRRLENLQFTGDKAYYYQPLKFPRIARGIPPDFTNAPIEVKRAQVTWAAEIVREELYEKRRNTEACIALGFLTDAGTATGGTPESVKTLLHRWLTSWRRV